MSFRASGRNSQHADKVSLSIVLILIKSGVSQAWKSFVGSQEPEILKNVPLDCSRFGEHSAEVSIVVFFEAQSTFRWSFNVT